ncbi:hypothetical protein [uncultured Fibrobacter sp.]|uniref:hypothetical protein n=1 Tax=uncultured Fibrobacter sp. TaxID=261512 RepID=UPI00260DC1DC|nr:hypothetical protein [uncultured Fibrobacter sp.]
MLNLKQISYIGLALCALTACSLEDSSVAGTTTVPNATAENISSSSEVAASSSDGASVSSSQGNSANVAQDIVFSTKATAKEPLSRGEIVVYGEENGAIAACTADGKSYEAKLKVNNGLVEKSIEMKNFGSSCDSFLAEFIASCHSNVSVNNGKNSEQSCDENGNVKAYCFDDGSIPADTTVDFNKAFNSLSNFSGELCYAITTGANSTTMLFSTLSSTSRDFSSSSVFVETSHDPIDPNEKCIEETGKKCDDNNPVDTPVVDPRQELPSSPAVGIDTSANRSFIIKPDVETLNVSDDERAVLDSLAMAFPSKSEIDQFDGLWVYEAARYYAFGSSSEKYYVGAGSTRCDVDVFRDKFGLERSANWLSGYYNLRNLYNTILQYSDSVIVYLVAGSMESESVETLFRTECESVAGSFYNYPSKGMVNNVGMACAVKNFTGVTLDAILGQQASLCENMYVTLVHPVQD